MTLKIWVKVKFKVTKMKPKYDFLLVFNSNYIHILHGFLDISHKHICSDITKMLICIKF